MERKIKIAALFMALFFTFSECKFFDGISDSDDDDDIDFGTLSLSENEISMDIGSMEIVKVALSQNQNKANVKWEFDSSIVSGQGDNYGIVLTGLASGQTTLTASCAGQKQTCVVSVSSYRHSVDIENPYIYASADVVNVPVGSQEKIFASAFGSDNDVISSWSFTCDNTAVASLYVEGNYCWITGLKTGQARITVTNSKVSAYPYTILVNSFVDSVKTPYLTTDSNVVSIDLSNTDSASFSVELKNPVDTSTKNDFTYKLVDSDGNSVSGGVFTVDAANGNFNVTASGAGMAILRVSHADSSYDLDIILRASAEADIASIGTESSIVTLAGNTTQTISFYLKNLPSDKTDDGTGWKYTYSDGADAYAVFNESGPVVAVTPKAVGMFKITASHPYSGASCSVAVIIKDLPSSAASASTYITTSQNYITMSPGGDSTYVTVTIYNAKAGAEKQLSWSIQSKPDDGSSDKIVEFAGGDGEAKYVSASSSRAAYGISDCVICTGEIKPLGKTGTARITLSHPDALYTSEILVRVKASASTADSLVLSLDKNFVKLLPGEETVITASLSGSSKSDGDENSIAWECTAKDVSFSGSGSTAAVSLPEEFSGSGSGLISAGSDKAGNTVKIPVLYAGSEEELAALKSIYATGTTNFTLYTGGSPMQIVLGTLNLTDDDLSAINWTVESGNNSVISISVLDKSCIEVTPLRKGVGQVRAYAEGMGEVTYYFVVKTEGVIDDSADCYLTTSDNVVYFSGKGVTKEFSVNGVNLNSYQLRSCEYKLEPEGSYSLIYDNGKFTAESLTDTAEAKLTVKHPLSENELSIVLRTGNEYQFVNPDVTYISSGVQSVQMLVSDDEKLLTFAVVHTGSDTIEDKGFAFSLKDGSATSSTTAENSVVSASYAPDGSFILLKPKSVGVTELYVDYEGCQQLSIPVVIAEDVPIDSIPYITTDTNVVTVIEGEYTPVTATLRNCGSSSDNDWTWISEDFDVASVAVAKGSTVMLLGKKAGNTTLRVSNSKVSPNYALSLTVVCVDKSVAQAKPYIQLSKNVLTLTTGTSETVTAEMVGGSADAGLYFEWACSDTSVAFVSHTGNDTVLVKGLKAGLTTITVTNGKYPASDGYYSKRIVVRVEDDVSEGRYISLSSSLLRLSPDDTDGTRISATLVNSRDETDAQDFIWWVDDPTLVTFSSNAGTALVTPTGLSGTTYVHCKHSKALKQADVIVYVSKYTEFAFPSDSETIQAGKVYFLNMSVPETESESYVEYESQDTNVCVIEGTKSVCFIEGVEQGQVILSARLKNKATGKTISSASLPVYVKPAAASDIEVTPQTSILTIKISESATLNASVSGTNIVSDSANLDLKWRWKTADVTEDKMYILKPTSQSEASGPSVKVTAKRAGDYILECYYEKNGATYSSDILISVPAAKEKKITIPSSKTIFKSDESFEIKATIINGDDSDLQNLKWSAGKYNGKNILRVAGTGESTSCMASGVGNSVVYARLPDGTVSNPCIVIIKPDATFSFAAQSVHVIPGMSEEIPFELDPAGTNMLFESIGNNGLVASDYYTYEVNNVESKITVRGIKSYEGAAVGSIRGIIIGKSGSGLDSLGSNSSLNVYVETHPLLDTTLAGQIYIQNPDSSVKGYMPKSDNGVRVAKPKAQIDKETAQRTFTYTAWPANMDVSIRVEKNGAVVENLLTWTCEETYVLVGGRNEKHGKVVLIPHGECNSGDNVNLVITGAPPANSKDSYSQSVLTYPVIMTYDDYELKLVTKELQAGAFTGYDEKKGITLGDGEEIVFALDVDRNYNENATIPEVSAAYSPVGGTDKNNSTFVQLSKSKASDGGSQYFSLKHKFDHRQFTPTVNEVDGGWTDEQREAAPDSPAPSGTKVMPSYFYITREMLGTFGSGGTLTYNETYDEAVTVTKEFNGVFSPIYKYYDENGAVAYATDFGDRNVWDVDAETGVDSKNFVYDSNGYASLSQNITWVSKSLVVVKGKVYLPDSEGNPIGSPIGPVHTHGSTHKVYDKETHKYKKVKDNFIDAEYARNLASLSYNDFFKCSSDFDGNLVDENGVAYSSDRIYGKIKSVSSSTNISDAYEDLGLIVVNARGQVVDANNIHCIEGIKVKIPVKTTISFTYYEPKTREVKVNGGIRMALSGKWVGERHKHKKTRHHKKYWGHDHSARYYLYNGIPLNNTDYLAIMIDENSGSIHGKADCDNRLLKYGISGLSSTGGYQEHRGYDANTYQKDFWGMVFSSKGYKLEYAEEPDYFIPTSELQSKHSLFFVTPGQTVYSSLGSNSRFHYGIPGYGSDHYDFPSGFLYYPLRQYMTPACAPDESVVNSGSGCNKGKISITYVMKNNVVKKTVKDVPVTVEVRNCPAYTNAGWKRYKVSFPARNLSEEVRWYRKSDVPTLRRLGYTVTEY